MNSLKEYHDEWVRDLVIILKDKVRGGRLFGMPINIDNLEEVLCAVYLLEVVRKGCSWE